MLITACTIEEDEDRETPNEYKKKKKKNERKAQCTQKQLHGKLISQAMGKESEDQWDG